MNISGRDIRILKGNGLAKAKPGKKHEPCELKPPGILMQAESSQKRIRLVFFQIFVCRVAKFRFTFFDRHEFSRNIPGYILVLLTPPEKRLHAPDIFVICAGLTA